MCNEILFEELRGVTELKTFRRAFCQMAKDLKMEIVTASSFCYLNEKVDFHSSAHYTRKTFFMKGKAQSRSFIIMSLCCHR